MTLKKSLKRFLTKYISDVDLYYKGNLLITAVVDDSIFPKIFKIILGRKMLEEDITFTRLLQRRNYN